MINILHMNFETPLDDAASACQAEVSLLAQGP